MSDREIQSIISCCVILKNISLYCFFLCLLLFLGVFITKGDVGVGTIVGSAVFNVLVIIGLCGIFAGQVHTHKLPITICRFLLPVNHNRCFTSSVCKFSPQPISLSWWPLFRDAFFYILSVLVLILVRNSLKPLTKTDLVLDISHVWKDTKVVSQTAEKDTWLRWEEGLFIECGNIVLAMFVVAKETLLIRHIKHASIERNVYIYSHSSL